MSGTPSSGESAQPAESLRDEIAHLQQAVRSQRDIGMAIGLMSARFSCSTEQAWRLMLRISQDSNVKVRTVARILVATHDGTSGPEDARTMQDFHDQLPASGWPAGPWLEEDSAP